MTMILLTTLAILVYITYMVVCAIVFKWPSESISETYYLWEKEGILEGKYNLGRYFTVWCCLVPFLIFPPSLVVSDCLLEQVAAFATCFGLITVGSAPTFKQKKYGVWHFVGAFISAGGAITYCISSGLLWYILVIFAICIIIAILTKKVDKTYWLEQACFISYLYCVLLKTILA